MAEYHYSRFWDCWSRRLSSDHPNGPFVDLNLTPNACSSRWNCYSWNEDVKPVRIRVHSTYSVRGDLDTDELPSRIQELMINNLGEELANHLLTGNFLPQLRKYCY